MTTAIIITAAYLWLLLAYLLAVRWHRGATERARSVKRLERQIAIEVNEARVESQLLLMERAQEMRDEDTPPWKRGE